MPTSDPGSDLLPTKPTLSAERGFTLLELMVVVALIAITTAVVAFAVPDPSSTRLEREAARLTAILESARVQARSGAMTIQWIPESNGRGDDYQFIGLPQAFMPSLKWDAADVKAEVVNGNGGIGRGKSIVLGPEPVIGAQSVILRLEDRQIIIGTDGLSPFDVITGEPGEGEEAAEGGSRAPTP